MMQEQGKFETSGNEPIMYKGEIAEDKYWEDPKDNAVLRLGKHPPGLDNAVKDIDDTMWVFASFLL
jgi:hypothetical protein